MPENTWEIVMAAGALGTAAFGIVEGLKRSAWIGEAGFPTILRILGRIVDTLAVAYGPDVEALLRAQYRGEPRELARVIRQGARIGLTPQNALPVAQAFGLVDPHTLAEAAEALNAGDDLRPELRNVLGRFELAVDARIDAALTLAQNEYAMAARLAASAISVGIALVVGWRMDPTGAQLPVAAIVGFLAVPLAPVAKDLVSALKSASQALRARQ
jgi:hypothetical protein